MIPISCEIRNADAQNAQVTAKKLMRRLEGLGANTVLEMGMGDDQVGEGCEGLDTSGSPG